MKVIYCHACGKPTGHKRSLGWGTFFGALITLGISLFFIPFYPVRCVVCGCDQGNGPINKSQADYNYTPVISPNNNEIDNTGKIKELCPHCQKPMKAEYNYCRYCGKKVINYMSSPVINNSQSTKKCPYCAEDIKYEAIKCKHCGPNITNE